MDTFPVEIAIPEGFRFVPPVVAEKIALAKATGGWIGFDLDRTLATYRFGQQSVIGNPVKPIGDYLRLAIYNDVNVKIMTARAHDEPYGPQIDTINAWTMVHFGQVFPVTASKDYNMVALFDDLAIGVEANTGRLIGYPIKEDSPAE